jgi:hypothetical protein
MTTDAGDRTVAINQVALAAGDAVPQLSPIVVVARLVATVAAAALAILVLLPAAVAAQVASGL